MRKLLKNHLPGRRSGVAKLKTAVTCILAASLLPFHFAEGVIIAGPKIPPPTSVLPAGYTNTSLEGFDENQGVTLTTNLQCDPGGYYLLAGDTVDSHMILLNTGGASVSGTQRFSFDGLIVGVMSDEDGVFEAASSKPPLGHPPTTYPASASSYRGLEPSMGDGYEVVGNSIEVTSSVTSPGDWIRVVTRRGNRVGVTFSITAGDPTDGLADPWDGTNIGPGDILTVGDPAGVARMPNPPRPTTTATPPGVLVKASALKLFPGSHGSIEIDALSYGRDIGNRFVFSVDRYAYGTPGTAVRTEATMNEASADLFSGDGAGGNVLWIDGGRFGLIEPSGDDLDAVDLRTFARHLMRRIYFSLDNATAAANGFLGGDILVFDVRTGTVNVYLSSFDAGLDPQGDNIDAVAVEDDGDGIYDPLNDEVFFSIDGPSPSIGSPDCRLGVGITRGDILQPPVQYGCPPGNPPAIVAAASALGLVPDQYDELNALDRINWSAPEVSSVEYTGASVEITFPVIWELMQVGIEYSADLGQETWIDLGDATVSEGIGTFVDSDPARVLEGRGYYRTILRP